MLKRHVVGTVFAFTLLLLPFGGALAQSEMPVGVSGRATQVVPRVNVSKEHVRGDRKATLLLVEYSDLQCPFCARVHPTIKQVLAEYPKDVAWVYRHYPLAFHEHAMPGAIASECVHEQGGNTAFWKFIDQVFETEQFDFDAIVKDLKLDEVQFKACMRKPSVRRQILRQINAGMAAGVLGTPHSFLINQRTKEVQSVSGAQPIEAFREAVDSMLGKKQ